MAILLPQRSPYCSPNPPLLIGSEGRIRDAANFDRAELGKPLSTTSNLLFGNLQHRVDENSWVPVHGFRRGRIKLLAGSPAPSRGGQSRPHCCRSMRSRFGVLPSARFRFQSLHSHQARTCCSSIFRMRCHMRTAKRRITATSAIFFFFGFRETNRW